MIGDRFQLEVNLSTWEGADSAALEVRQALVSCGLLWMATPPTGELLPGEHEAYLRGERMVESLVTVEVEALAALDSDQVLDVMFGALDKRGSRPNGGSCGWIGVAGSEAGR